MHIVHASLSDINTSKSKKKPTVKQQKAMAEHDVWLKKQGLHPDQLSNRKSKPNKLKKSFVMNKNEPQCSNGFAQGGFKTSIFDSNWNKRYEDNPELAARETIALRKAEELKGNLMALYNKGPVMLKTKSLRMDELGKRR